MRPNPPSRLSKIALTTLLTAFSLLAEVASADTILISAGKGADNDVRNGGFESTDNDRTAYSRLGNSDSQSGFEAWRNYRFPQDRIGRNASFSSPEGKYRGIVNSVTSGPNSVNGAEPSVDTEHTIQRGDKFTLSFKHAGALGWTEATRLKVIAILYYDDDGDCQDGKDTVIDSVTVTPSSNANMDEDYVFSGDLTLAATSDSVGKVARLRFQTNLDQNVYAVIDDVTLKVSSKTEADSNPLITIQAGDLPIVLSAPHGGREAVPGVPERRGIGVKSFASRSDTNTDRLTEQLADALEKEFGKRPYVVIARFHRRYIDANRRKDAAYESDKARDTYDAYHQALAKARSQIIERWGRGILLDIHGQSAEMQAIIRGTQNGRTTTHLVSRFGRLALVGETSLFGQLARQRFPVIPAVDSTDLEHVNYDGGHIVVTYGSAAGGTLDAIQLEVGRDLRSAEAIESTASKLAKATTAFAKEYLPASERGTQTSIKPDLQDKVQVGVYVDEGTGRSVNVLLSALSKFEEVSVTKLTADEIRSGRLSDLDILIQPGGSGGGQGRHLAEAGRNEIRGFVRDGGGFIGICAGAYLASADYEWSLNVLDAKVVDRKHWNRGSGTVDIAVTDAGKQLLRPTREKLAIHYAQGPLLAPGNRPDIDDYEVIATFETEIAEKGAPSGVMKGTTAIARGQFGRGRVICFSPHPEMTQGLEQLVQFAIDHVRRKSSAQDTQ